MSLSSKPLTFWEDIDILARVLKSAEKVNKPKVQRSPSLVAWIARKGGINYKREYWKGELDILLEGIPSLKVYKKLDRGSTLDELSMKAFAEGYLSEATPKALILALERGKQA